MSTNDTLREIDDFIAAIGPDLRRCDREWLAKIRAHVVADELDTQRLRGEFLTSACSNAQPVYTDGDAERILGLSPKWRTAPQEARRAAHLMPSVRICGAKPNTPLDDDEVCRREPGHSGTHCPAEDGACGVDHG